jgi:hypothetical protein
MELSVSIQNQKTFPIYSFLKTTTNKTELYLKCTNKDATGCCALFEMQFRLPILSVMKNIAIHFIYSSWGSDLYDYQNLGLLKQKQFSFKPRSII